MWWGIAGVCERHVEVHFCKKSKDIIRSHCFGNQEPAVRREMYRSSVHAGPPNGPARSQVGVLLCLHHRAKSMAACFERIQRVHLPAAAKVRSPLFMPSYFPKPEFPPGNVLHPEDALSRIRPTTVLLRLSLHIHFKTSMLSASIAQG